MKVYEVTGYWPEVYGESVDGKRGAIIRGGRHVGAFIQCSSAGRAAEIIETKYPGVTVGSVVRKGSREIIVDKVTP